MSSGHPSFDHTVQEANIWLKAVATELHFEDRRHAYSALRAALHALRDRLQPQNEGWRLTDKPTADHTVDEFCAAVGKELPPRFPMDARTLSRGVFQLSSSSSTPANLRK